MNNQATLTLKRFADELGLLDKHYATARYKNIFNTRHLASEKERLKSNSALFKQSEECKLHWLERPRRKTQLNTHESCAEYVQDVVEQETTALTSTTPTSTTESLTTAGTTDVAEAGYQESIAAIETTTSDVKNTTPLKPWKVPGHERSPAIHEISASRYQNDYGSVALY